MTGGNSLPSERVASLFNVFQNFAGYIDNTTLFSCVFPIQVEYSELGIMYQLTSKMKNISIKYNKILV